jgi:hypothetical protein
MKEELCEMNIPYTCITEETTREQKRIVKKLKVRHL